MDMILTLHDDRKSGNFKMGIIKTPLSWTVEKGCIQVSKCKITCPVQMLIRDFHMDYSSKVPVPATVVVPNFNQQSLYSKTPGTI